MMKKETQEFLQEFLLFSYFGIDYKRQNNTEIDIINKCAQRAYLDLNRTLKFKDSNENNRIEFRNEICETIVKGISKLPKKEEEFNNWHKKLCEEIAEFANKKETILKPIPKNKDLPGDFKEKCFYYGQAQKWLNMTLKYMWLLGYVKDNIACYLHVPVDSYIIEAVCKNIPKDIDLSGVDLPFKSENKKRKADNIIPWSKWEYDEYNNFQKSLREALGTQLPIEWEGEAWLEIANGRSGKNNNKNS